jgi:uncharacterized protein YbjT (DUF2867 family)
MILVTGANGFVGSALIERLVAEDIRVRAAVRTSAAASMLCAKYPQVDVVTVGGMARCAGGDRFGRALGVARARYA